MIHVDGSSSLASRVWDMRRDRIDVIYLSYANIFRVFPVETSAKGNTFPAFRQQCLLCQARGRGMPRV
ncbi:hypothetical protein D6C00_12655 [Thiohalobacter thiocyanaticus]|uniref:Uncharacterized protein n=1 Tax=Thiohalobacter thiocyanaticus TaxID=585455 RepID=A0A426QLP1_9GAMM|nr:hypothetical protein D6C00_12655 [Thiohalobacter thiocyanaticus]